MNDTPYNERTILDRYGLKWGLSDIKKIHKNVVNSVYTCHSETYGDVILKWASPSKNEIRRECHVLLEYKDSKFCRVFEKDLDHGVMLLERIKPGHTLRMVPDLEKRLSVFMTLYKNFHIKVMGENDYPTYLDWVKKITDYMSGQHDFKELSEHMQNACHLCESLVKRYNGKMLLHGDFHHDNILMSENGYRVIDPKGVVGDKVFDTPRFILNEFNDELCESNQIKIGKIISTFSKGLDVPKEILKQCLYIETAMSVCWEVESGATLNDLERLLDKVAFARRLMV